MGSGYHTPASQPNTFTTYDAPGRPWVITAPDNSTTNSYPATPVNDPGVSYVNAYGTYQETRQASYPGTSLYRSNWGTAQGRSGYGYVISNHA